ncbi:uncharacterized protein LOC120270359 [Dioscorea cayenensis subsp. rotundata]|uniref:Uncharacterized protein LOC120270359 n=1 Tax=Dioscorea cayennensis subsp. rotundata TaxID=55577 RepID=A0AB40C0X3_DIOCR|nr:uncharacterized protein LOC120270359 [Dioscorea cayenensis subsp. rotundata]
MPLRQVKRLEPTWSTRTKTTSTPRFFWCLRPSCTSTNVYFVRWSESRVAFSKITFKKPHIILLDEPSNHLDLDAVGALIQGLVIFQGGVLMVSHDEHLISSSICSMIQNSLQSYILELLLKSLCSPCLFFKMDNKIIQTCHSTSIKNELDFVLLDVLTILFCIGLLFWMLIDRIVYFAMYYKSYC